MSQEEHMKRAFVLATRSVEKGNHPFGAVLILDNKLVLEAENTVETERDATGHAETNLCRLASKAYSAEELKGATLVTSTEPCVMCSGAIYWTGIKRIVYGLPESELLKLTGEGNATNPTLSLPTEKLFEVGNIKGIEVVGPILQEEARKVHGDFWQTHF
jgi:tRNA(Arg) A34 adenosine deaminase TadA